MHRVPWLLPAEVRQVREAVRGGTRDLPGRFPTRIVTVSKLDFWK